MTTRRSYKGRAFNFPDRHQEGDIMSAAEANCVNRHEQAKWYMMVVKWLKAGDDDELQQRIDLLAERYQLGAKGSNGSDPVAARAMQIGKHRILEHLKGKGIHAKDVSMRTLTDRAKALIAKDPSIIKLARSQVNELAGMKSAHLDEVLKGLSG
jgi:hypothetical protein